MEEKKRKEEEEEKRVKQQQGLVLGVKGVGCQGEGELVLTFMEHLVELESKTEYDRFENCLLHICSMKNVAFKYFDISLKIMSGCVCNYKTSGIYFWLLFKNHEFEASS